MPLYVSLVLALAAAGAVNQGLYRQRVALLDQKESLMAQLSTLRVQAAQVRGPLAVARFADEHGMVPAPEAKTVIPVAPSPAPHYVPPSEGLEIRTIWR